MFIPLISLALSAVLSIQPISSYPAPAPSPAFIDKTVRAPEVKAEEQLSTERLMTLTAYSSSVDETDSSPFITASGSHTRDGIVATNDLPFGTRIRVPGMFGDKVFVVEDRMHRRYTKRDYLDFWMPSKQEALRFGLVRSAMVEVLDN